MEENSLEFFRRIINKMASAIKSNMIIKRKSNDKSPYSLFVIQRNRYGKRGEKSLVGTTLIVRPSWSDKKNGEPE